MMEDSCCIGLNLKQRYTDRDGKMIKIDIDDISLVEEELLKVRSSIHEFDLVNNCSPLKKNARTDRTFNHGKERLRISQRIFTVLLQLH